MDRRLCTADTHLQLLVRGEHDLLPKDAIAALRQALRLGALPLHEEVG